nr:hypothetical protein OG781_01895 [Streptomyces sp. NBC_00830]
MSSAVSRRGVLLAAAGVPAALTLRPLPAAAAPAPSADGSGADSVRGWTILSDSDTGAEAVIAAAADDPYRINHLQLSHQIVDSLSDLRDTATRERVNRLTARAHAAGIGEVNVWDHQLAKLSYYPERFRTGPGGTLDLDSAEFWQWFQDDYRSMLDLVPDVDGIVLTFIETGARIDRQYSARLTTAEQKMAYLIDRIAEVVVEERRLQLYLRTFGYYPAERQRHVDAVNMVSNPKVRVMVKATPHDFFLTHPNDTSVPDLRHPVLVEYDATGEFNGQGKIAGAWPEEHMDRMRYFRTLPNVIGYVARTDRYDDSRIIGTPTEINLYALARADRDPSLRPTDIYREFSTGAYGAAAAPKVASALAKSYDIVTSVLYSLGTNTANHSRLDFDPYCSSWNRSVSGKWVEPPVVRVGHTVNQEFHYWKDVVEHLGVPTCKISDTTRAEAPWVLENGWLTGANAMDTTYLHYVIKEKKYGVGLARAALREIQDARPYLTEAGYAQLDAYFARTVLTARLQLAISTAYFGYRVYVRGPEHRTEDLRALIWSGLDEAAVVADAIRAYPGQAASGEWNWVRDAAEADKYRTRIEQGWDRYGNVAVPRPADPADTSTTL